MRIVMLCRLYWPHLGGVEKHVQKLSEQCVAHGHTVDIFTLPHEDTLPVFEVQNGIRIHRKPPQLHSRVFKHLLQLTPLSKSLQAKLVERDELWGWMLWNLPKFLRADVIHIHDVFFWYWPIRILLPRKKVCMTFHGFEAGKPHHNPLPSTSSGLSLGKEMESTPTPQAKRARQRAAHWTKGNIAVGAWIEKWYGTRADAVTYGACDCAVQLRNNSDLKQTSNTQYPIFNKQKKRKNKAIFVGRLEDDTGVEHYTAVLSKQKKFEFDVYGHGPLEEKISAKRFENISLKGTTPNACFLYPSYDLACVSSYLSILEAMQCGTPVVAYAADELKVDYLKSHPMADHMTICTNKKELESFFERIKWKELYQQATRAKAWADTQMWESMYETYRKLWNQS